MIVRALFSLCHHCPAIYRMLFFFLYSGLGTGLLDTQFYLFNLTYDTLRTQRIVYNVNILNGTTCNALIMRDPLFLVYFLSFKSSLMFSVLVCSGFVRCSYSCPLLYPLFVLEVNFSESYILLDWVRLRFKLSFCSYSQYDFILLCMLLLL